MTGTYDWNPMPHKVDVKCPHCGQRAEFEFAEVCRIERKTDIDFFKNSATFEYRQFQDSCGHYWHGALYFAGLHGDPRTAVRDLPPGYKPSDWSHSKYLYRSHGLHIGSVRCEHCQFRAKYNLTWPDDAYFSISYRNNVLWAFNRESCRVRIAHHSQILTYQPHRKGALCAPYMTNITLKRDAPCRGGFEVLYFFSFGGYTGLLWQARPLASR